MVSQMLRNLHSFFFSYTHSRCSQLKATISDKGMEILFGDTFRTRDGYYALDLFRVIAYHDLEEFSNVLKAAITDIEVKNLSVFGV